MADKIKTGLGDKVDRLVDRSPSLKQMLAQAQRLKGFQISRGQEMGSSYHTITVNAQESALEQVLGLAHEVAHLINRRGIIPGGSSFQEFINRNVEAQIQEEGAAVRAEIQVRKEIRTSGVEVPLQVVGERVMINLEHLVNNKAKFIEVLRTVPSELTDGEALETYWRSHFNSPQMRGLFKGLSAPPAKKPQKRPTGSIFERGGILLACADNNFVPNLVTHLPRPPVREPGRSFEPVSPEPGSLRWLAQGLERPSPFRPPPPPPPTPLSPEPGSWRWPAQGLARPSPFRPPPPPPLSPIAPEPGSLRWLAQGLERPSPFRPPPPPPLSPVTPEPGSLRWLAQGLERPSPFRPPPPPLSPLTPEPGSLRWLAQGLG